MINSIKVNCKNKVIDYQIIIFKMKKSLFKLSIYGGGIYGAYTFYNNRIRSAPANPMLHE